MSITDKTQAASHRITEPVRARYIALVSFLAMLRGMSLDELEGWAESEVQAWGDPLGVLEPRAERAQSGIVETVLLVVVVAVVGIVGILVYSEVNSAIEVTGTLSDSANDLTDGFGTATGMLSVVVIVLVASLVLIIIRGI